MWPDNTIPELYDRVLTYDPRQAWDFSKWVPDVVVINLGTNDFAQANPDEKNWTAAYRQFIARVRGHYPQAQIYCATGPCLGDDQARKAKSTLLAYVNSIVAAEQAAGDKKVHALDFGQQSLEDGVGADWHPGVKTQSIMAGKLEDAVRRDLGWR
jgi:lysophospholipase L1-like esterase